MFNDFDNYAWRLSIIDDTCRLYELLRPLLQNTEGKARINENLKARIEIAIKFFDGEIDLRTLASWLLFSGKQVYDFDCLLRSPWYNRLPKNPPDAAMTKIYLEGLEITRESFETLIPRYIACDLPSAVRAKTLLILDPPYISTDCSSYSARFKLIDFLKLASLTQPPFIYFSSDKSEFPDYLDYMISNKIEGYQRFAGYQQHSLTARVNYSHGYRDHMFWKF